MGLRRACVFGDWRRVLCNRGWRWRVWSRINADSQTPFFLALLLFSAGSFFVYAAGCFFSARMKVEFERYGFGRQRFFIGGLQLLGAAALVLGLVIPLLGALGSGGLAAQMLAAVAVRVRIRDSLLQTTPAVGYLLLNAWLFAAFLDLAAKR